MSITRIPLLNIEPMIFSLGSRLMFGAHARVTWYYWPFLIVRILYNNTFLDLLSWIWANVRILDTAGFFCWLQYFWHLVRETNKKNLAFSCWSWNDPKSCLVAHFFIWNPILKHSTSRNFQNPIKPFSENSIHSIHQFQHFDPKSIKPYIRSTERSEHVAIYM